MSQMLNVAKAALKIVQYFMEGVRIIVHDHQQFCQHSIPDYLLQGDELRANNRLRIFDEFVGILCFDACTPTNHSKEDVTFNNKLIEHLNHPVAHIKRPEPPQEIEPVQALLVDGLRVWTTPAYCPVVSM